MIRAVLVRHASAGQREKWNGDDRLRPLDDRGTAQAEGLSSALAPEQPPRILASPYVRCVDTVVQLAGRLGLEVETRAELAEGASRESALELLREAGEGAVHCTHGDVLELLLGSEGQKGAAWIVEVDGQDVRAVGEIPPAA